MQEYPLTTLFVVLKARQDALECTAFVLREIFDYEYTQIAGIIGQDEAACRELISRAKKRMAYNPVRHKSSPQLHRKLTVIFKEAAEAADVAGLMSLLSEDVILWVDGGRGDGGTVTDPLRGRDAVARFIVASSRHDWGKARALDAVEVNGEPGLIVREFRAAKIVLSFEIGGTHIRQIYFIANPDKLGHL